MPAKTFVFTKKHAVNPENRVCLIDRNSKLGCIWNTSLPPIQTCQPNSPCFELCYAMKSFRQYPAVKRAWTQNLNTYRTSPAEYFRQLDIFFQEKKPETFRWLVAGDIPDNQYMYGILKLANRYPRTNMCLFSKNYPALLEMSMIVRPRNLTVLVSAWPNHPIPDALRTEYRTAWMQDGRERRAPKNAILCQGSCEDCLKCYNPRVTRDVILPLH